MDSSSLKSTLFLDLKNHFFKRTFWSHWLFKSCRRLTQVALIITFCSQDVCSSDKADLSHILNQENHPIAFSFGKGDLSHILNQENRPIPFSFGKADLSHILNQENQPISFSFGRADLSDILNEENRPIPSSFPLDAFADNMLTVPPIRLQKKLKPEEILQQLFDMHEYFRVNYYENSACPLGWYCLQYLKDFMSSLIIVINSLKLAGHNPLSSAISPLQKQNLDHCDMLLKCYREAGEKVDQVSNLFLQVQTNVLYSQELPQRLLTGAIEETKKATENLKNFLDRQTKDAGEYYPTGDRRWFQENGTS